MKKGLGIALVLALAVMLMPSAVFAAEPTDADIDIKWGGGEVDGGGYPVNFGAGWVSGTVVVGKTLAGGELATTNFQSVCIPEGGIKGVFTADYNVGGGPHSGNSYVTSMDASVEDGIIEFITDRGCCGGYVGMRGHSQLGGQQSYSFIGTGLYLPPTLPIAPPVDLNYFGIVPGTAYMAMKTSTAAIFTPFTGGETGISDITQHWSYSGSHNFDATGAYTILRQMTAADGDYAQAYAVGSGTAQMDCEHSSASKYVVDDLSLGDFAGANLASRSGYNWGYNQDFNAEGTGLFSVTGVGHNEVFKAGGFISGGYAVTSTTGSISTLSDGFHTYGTTAPGSCDLMLQAFTNTPVPTLVFTDGWSISDYSMTVK